MRVRLNSTFENSLFFLYFLSKDISVSIPCKFLKFGIYFHECHSEGSLSQNIYIGPTFYVMKS